MTLLEVLAAVALLGIVYTALATKATQGVMSESDSFRRFHASLLADQTLAELETDMANGLPPALGNEETDSDDGIFTVQVEVTPWSPPLPPPDPKKFTNSPDVFGGNDAAESVLRQIRVRISWDNGIGERSIERVTFALDTALLQTLAGPAEDEGSRS